VLVGVTVQGMGQLLLTYAPFMQSVFGTAPIAIDTWGRILLIALGASVVVGIDKWARSRRPAPGLTRRS